MRSSAASQLRFTLALLLGGLTELAATATPAPLSLTFGTKFFGSDGYWSAVQIGVGTPDQWLSVYPSTTSPETWVIGPGGCADVTCQAARGGVFTANDSKTYTHFGTFDLGYTRLGSLPDYGDYGLDNVSITDSVSAPAQVVSTLTDPSVWLGQLGLNVQEPEFSDKVHRLSMISTLVQNESLIPSHSYGYTAGAHYALKNVPGSLVLGGVDTTRFTPNNGSFSLSPGYMPTVAIQGITVASSQTQNSFALPGNWSSNPLTLMQQSQAALFTIDTSTPFLWMPAVVCDAFALALNLTYNESLYLYVFPSNSNSASSPTTLSSWNLTFTFNLADSVNAIQKIQIPISYEAFNLQLSYGFPGLGIQYGDSPVNYFPLRRTNLSTQYTIGRAFLQEAYLMVDYERNAFSISKAVLTDTSQILPRIVAITRPSNSKWPGPLGSDIDSLSTGTKAGIGVGVAVLVVAIILAILYLIRRHKNGQNDSESGSGKKKWKFRGTSNKSTVAVEVSELIGDRRQPRELLVDSSDTRFELPGNDPVEMPANEVPEIYLAANQTSDEPLVENANAENAVASGLTNHSSVRKDYNIRATTTERSASPAPPYSPSEVGRTTHSSSEGVSSYDSRLSPAGNGSNGSGSAGISPIAQYGTQSISRNGDSPISPEIRASQTMSSAEVSPGTHDGNRASTLAVSSDRISRTASRNSRFREDLTDEPTITPETEGEARHLRPRYSWEE